MSEFSIISRNDANVSGTDGLTLTRARCMEHLRDGKLKYCPALGLLKIKKKRILKIILYQYCKYTNDEHYRHDQSDFESHLDYSKGHLYGPYFALWLAN